MSDIVSSNSLLQLIRCICIAGKSTSRPDWGFNAAMDACLKAGQWKRSLELFREMSFLKLQKDAVSCNVAIMASSASSKWQHSLSVLNGQEADEISHTSCMTCTERKQWRLALIYLGQLGQQERAEIKFNQLQFSCQCLLTWRSLAFGLGALCMHEHIQNFYRCFYLQLSCFSLWPMGIGVVHTGCGGCGGRRGCHECRHRYMRSRWLDGRNQTARGYATKKDPRRPVRCVKTVKTRSEKWTGHRSQTSWERGDPSGPSGDTSDLHSTGLLLRSCTLGSCRKFAGGDAKCQGWEDSLMSSEGSHGLQ